MAAASHADAGKELISSQRILDHIKVLASDAFEGRGPGTVGEEKTVAYLSEQFKAAGAMPGNPDGSWVQNVPLVGIRSTPSWSFEGCASELKLSAPDEYVAWTTQVKPQVEIKASDLVFVGYGVVAPEYGWDDYKGLDVKGKTLVMLVNDPAIPDPTDPSKLDSNMFKGKAMTYYGRWTYKYEIAAAKGAAGAIIVHETGPASYPYEVVRNNGVGENMTLKPTDGNAGDVPMRSWIREDKARALLKGCGQDFDALKAAALKKDFKPVPLATKLTASISNSLREMQSKNVVALVPGADKHHKDEYVVYTAHWDHLGKTEEGGQTHIFNGAVDNASGVAALIEMARTFAADKKALRRSVLFVAVTAEEKGLLGSKYYADNPLYPLKKTVANLNIDSMQPWGKTRDIQVVGYGQTTIEDLIEHNAELQGRHVTPDSRPESGGYFRSDHFNLVKKGVPAAFLEGGEDVIGKPEGYGEQKGKEYGSHDYHKEDDDIKPDWDIAGFGQDAELYYLVGRDLARDLKNVDFKPGSEFKAVREQLLKN
ncbi:M20/M25/M40 family metallo-hydrolase [Permianibacter sp. IMCC34836]|uniref:M28 family metallopeptidase n=1 Tax=Permianibacter fluminis TaxID=2738515 RepID=UPI001552A501|nr:M28 family metallopeptidase [Permianibacter fluminis]NQD38250.1 M20/M25/M40 family metallo-hydrolase [Permianibacter fluminis]